MKLMIGILILVANLWQQLPVENTLHSIFDHVEEPGSGLTTQADPPDDGKVIIIPPPQ